MRYRATKNCHLGGGHDYGGGQHCKHCGFPRRIGGTRQRKAQPSKQQKVMGYDELMAQRRPVPKKEKKGNLFQRAAAYIRRVLPS